MLGPWISASPFYCQREINFVSVAGADLRDAVMKTGRPGPQHLVLLKKDWQDSVPTRERVLFGRCAILVVGCDGRRR